ncbi:hypothetical protein HPB49_009693 [Dermacentor silvarum]|uniref:Uncharacterized protein n=1 Tax=Dermacentor silvarum TaxID=543639 RepID=A0ACB8CEE8_DERSI|nr:hypothetical protein HPB49_009693 [Dermacentor silvarum]
MPLEESTQSTQWLGLALQPLDAFDFSNSASWSSGKSRLEDCVPHCLRTTESFTRSYFASPGEYLCRKISKVPFATECERQNSSLNGREDGRGHREAVVCPYCDRSFHERSECPTWNSVCNFCGKKGHFAEVCHSRKSKHAKLRAIELQALKSSAKAKFMDVTVENYTTKFKVDSGTKFSAVPSLCRSRRPVMLGMNDIVYRLEDAKSGGSTIACATSAPWVCA